MTQKPLTPEQYRANQRRMTFGMAYLLHPNKTDKELEEIAEQASRWYDDEMYELIIKVELMTTEGLRRIVEDESQPAERREWAYKTLAKRLADWLKNFLAR